MDRKKDNGRDDVRSRPGVVADDGTTSVEDDVGGGELLFASTTTWPWRRRRHHCSYRDNDVGRRVHPSNTGHIDQWQSFVVTSGPSQTADGTFDKIFLIQVRDVSKSLALPTNRNDLCSMMRRAKSQKSGNFVGHR
jgi:hypothetical protein